MTRRVLTVATVAVASLLALPARASDWFIGGVDLGGGPWVGPSPTVLSKAVQSFNGDLPGSGATTAGPNTNTLISHLSTSQKAAVASYDLNAATQMMKPFNDQFRPSLALHLGWDHVDPKWSHFVVEGVFQSAGFNPFGAVNTETGAGDIVGVRFYWSFLRLILPDSPFDFGVEGGGGSGFIGDDHFYRLTGAVFDAAVKGEYYIDPFVSLEVYFRANIAVFTDFYTHDSSNPNLVVYDVLSGVTSFWPEIGVGINFHAGAEGEHR